MPKKPTDTHSSSTPNYVVLKGSERPKHIAKPGEEITPAPLNETLDVRVSIQRHTPLPALTPRGVARILSLEEYEKTYGSSPDEIEAIAKFAAGQGLRLDRSDAGERAVWLSGKVSQFNEAFRTELKILKTASGETFRFREGPLMVPSALAKIIDSVDGLTNEPFGDIQLRTRAIHPAAAGQRGFSPLEIARYYNFPTNLNGAGQTIGIIELGGGFAQQDLDSYFTGLGLHPIPAPVIVPAFPGLGTNSPGNDDNSDGEVALDIEVVGAIAPGAQLVVYFAPDASGQSFLDAFTAAIHDDQNRPTIISISWGGPETKATEQYMEQFDDAMQTAAQLGITVCVATGDNASADYASNDPNWDQQAHVDFPASSPFALACGGTKITSKAEAVWHSGVNEGTGGGISSFFPLPDYQTTAGIPPAVNPSGPVNRGIPDVAGDADPSSGYQVSVGGVPKVIGGTSAVAPLWSALTALFNQSLNQRLGFLNPRLYAITAGGSAAFKDITDGDNGDYSAGPGWDACTGLGTPNGQALLAALQAPPAALGAAPAAGNHDLLVDADATSPGRYAQRIELAKRLLRMAESLLHPSPCDSCKASTSTASRGRLTQSFAGAPRDQVESTDDITMECIGQQTGTSLIDPGETLAQAGVSGDRLARCLNGQFGTNFSGADFPPTMTLGGCLRFVEQQA